jgi:hypothetical protein
VSGYLNYIACTCRISALTVSKHAPCLCYVQCIKVNISITYETKNAHLAIYVPYYKHLHVSVTFCDHHQGSFCFWCKSPTLARAASCSRFLDHIQWQSTVCKTPLLEGSARRRDNTQQSQQIDIHAPRRFRTRNSSKRAALDPRLRPLGYWNQYLQGVKYKYQEYNRIVCDEILQDLEHCKNCIKVSRPSFKHDKNWIKLWLCC